MENIKFLHRRFVHLAPQLNVPQLEIECNLPYGKLQDWDLTEAYNLTGEEALRLAVVLAKLTKQMQSTLKATVVLDRQGDVIEDITEGILLDILRSSSTSIYVEFLSGPRKGHEQQYGYEHKNGIVRFTDGRSGVAHSPYANIDSSARASVLWPTTPKSELATAFGFIYNTSMVHCSDPLEWLALAIIEGRYRLPLLTQAENVFISKEGRINLMPLPEPDAV